MPKLSLSLFATWYLSFSTPKISKCMELPCHFHHPWFNVVLQYYSCINIPTTHEFPWWLFLHVFFFSFLDLGGWLIIQECGPLQTLLFYEVFLLQEECHFLDYSCHHVTWQLGPNFHFLDTMIINKLMQEPFGNFTQNAVLILFSVLASKS